MIRDLFRRLGGPDAFSWITVALVYPSTLLFTLFGSGVTIEGDALPQLVLASVLSNTCMLVTLFFAHRCVRLSRVPEGLRPWLMLAAIVGSLAVRAFVMDQLILAFDLRNEPWFWYRFSASLPSTGGSITVVAIVVSLARDYRRKSEDLRRTLGLYERLAGTHEALIHEERNRVIVLARTSLNERLRDLGGEASPESLERVRRTIEDVVRPLSHRLNDRSSAELTLPPLAIEPVSMRTVVSDLFGKNSIRPFWFTLWATLTGLLYAPQLWGIELGLRFVVHITVVTFVSTLLIRMLWERVFVSRSWKVRATTFTMACVIVGGLYGYGSRAFTPLFQERILLHTVTLLCAALVAGWLFASLASLISNLATLDQHLELAETALHREQVTLNGRLHAEMRALGRFLHGPVQDALSVAAFRIRAAIDADETSTELVDELRTSILEAMEDMPAAERSPAATTEVLTQLAELWHGFTEITWSLSGEAEAALTEHSVTRASFNELIRETCSNAIRHGEASQVFITAKVCEGELELRVENPGVPIEHDASPGLGARLFDELALSWRFDVVTDRTQLVARLPLSR
jgi:hypothetical protein